MITVDGEVVTSVNGKLLAGHTIARRTDSGDDVDQVSVCSCTCVGPIQYDYNRDMLPVDPEPVYSPTEEPVVVFKRVSI